MNMSASLIAFRYRIWIGSFVALFAFATSPAFARAHKPVIIETSADGRFSVEQEHIKHHWYQNLVIRMRHRVYRVADTYDPDWDDAEEIYEKESPEPHEFYLSPNQKWLYVYKHIMSRVDVGYLYHFDGSRFVRVLPNGLKFDDAALRIFAKRIHTPLADIGSGRRSIGFEKWTTDGKGLIFWFEISKFWDKLPIYEVTGYYGLMSHRFKVISHRLE